MKYVEAIGVTALAFLSPIYGLLAVSGGLVLIDFLTGMWAAHKTGKPITSRRMGHTVAKMIAYQLAILSGFLIEKIAFGTLPPLPISSICSSVIALVEFKSIIENVTAISGRNLWEEILAKLGKRDGPK